MARSQSLSVASLLSGTDIVDLSGIASPWFPGLLSSLSDSNVTKIKLGDGRLIADSPAPNPRNTRVTERLRRAGLPFLARLLTPPDLDIWPIDDPAFRDRALEEACSKLTPKELEIEMQEMGCWWSTSNLRTLLSHVGPGLEGFGVKLGGHEPGFDARDVIVRKNGLKKLFGKKEEGGERKVEGKDGGLAVQSWSYGDETEVRFCVASGLLMIL